MKPRSFTTRGEISHRTWLSNILQVPYNMNGGIDLADDSVGIELKCRYQIYPPTFTIHEYQISRFKEENPDQKLFWAFLLYDLALQPKRIGRHNIGKLVTSRDVWFFDWDWVKQFPVSRPKTGPYVYVKRSFFPEDNHFHRFVKKGGTLYVPKDSALEERLANHPEICV